MPSRNVIKVYVEDGIYHIYNRGVEKRDIFLDNQDYRVFLRCLKDALSKPPDLKSQQKQVTFKGSTFKGIPRLPKNFHGQIELLAFCLMPNHFHLLIKQRTKELIKQFMQSIATRYPMYFNKKYQRVGALFQGIYKATLVTDESYLLHLSRYIHRNPKEHTTNLLGAYSSYADYLGQRKTEWIKPDIILSYFQPGTLPSLRHVSSYQSFVESEEINSEKFLGSMTLED